jgi:hypothetical protein
LNDKREGNAKSLSDEAARAFKGIGDYALHDKGDRQTAERVGFTAILNMEAETPDQAIGQMTASYERYREQEAHKRGRKLTKPVYVYSLAWAEDQTPDREEMMGAAASSLKALRLEGLQTLIVQHTDEAHPHIHIIVNRIEPDGKRARNIPFDQLRFSRWAEEYEREHGGIRCEQRVENNERRRNGEFVKDTISLTPAEYKAREQAQREQSESWRREQDAFQKEAHRGQKAALWQRQVQERNALEAKTRQRIERERPIVKERFKPEWTKVYRRQANRLAELRFANRSGIFERAAFLYRHKGLLKSAGPMRMRDVVRLCLSGKALANRVDRAHRMERGIVAKWERQLADGAVKIAWREHAQDFQIMRQRQDMERTRLNYVQQAKLQNVARQREAGLDRPPEPRAPIQENVQVPVRAPELKSGENIEPETAKQYLTDQPRPKLRFNWAAEPLKGRAADEDFERRMADFKRRYPGWDRGREL